MKRPQLQLKARRIAHPPRGKDSIPAAKLSLAVANVLTPIPSIRSRSQNKGKMYKSKLIAGKYVYHVQSGNVGRVLSAASNVNQPACTSDNRVWVKYTQRTGKYKGVSRYAVWKISSLRRYDLYKRKPAA